MKVLQFPLARVTLLFMGGIWAAHQLGFNPETTFCIVIAAAILVAFLFAMVKGKTSFQPYFGLAVCFFSFAIGISTFTIHNASLDKSNYIHRFNGEEKQKLVLVIREKLRSSFKNDRYIAMVRQIGPHSCSGRILINLRKAEFSQSFGTGTVLLVSGKIERPRKPDNPDQFDYGSYLINKSILAQMYVGAADVKRANAFDKDVFYYADRLRNRILKNLEKSHFGKAELAVVAALILGQQQDIAPEILHDYQFAGAVHVLSVSGLHVGFILLFLNFLLDFLPRNKAGSLFKLVIVIASLWGFAIIAGLSPSIVRSVTMFSFVALGMHLRRQTNIFHTLLVSMLLILLFEPSFLFDVGFQLSYLALFFILWLQPLFAGLWTPRYRIVNYFWEILTVSFAAQIGTLPLSIYYFHQFPGLFFVTNLVIIPFLGVIMALGVVVMILACFNIVPAILAAGLEWSIIILNKIIAAIASMDGFIFQDIPFNDHMLLSLYLFIVAAVFAFEKPIFKRIGIMLAALLVFQCCYFGARWSARSQREWIVFNARKSTLIAERTGENVTLYSSVPIQNNSILKSYLTANFCHIKSSCALMQTATFNSKKILVIDNFAWYPQNMRPDIIVMRQSPKVNLERLLAAYKPQVIVADGSNFKTYVKRWDATCRKEKIPFHATAEKGFYRLR